LQRERPGLPDYQVVVDDVTGGEIANIIRGYIAINGEKIRFKGIAYGRYGGQNVAPRLSPISKKKIKAAFGDVSKFEEDLQQKLVRGRLRGRPRRSGSLKEEGRARASPHALVKLLIFMPSTKPFASETS
jgi:hypothetical protein